MTFTDRLKAAKESAERCGSREWIKGSWSGQCNINHAHGGKECKYDYTLDEKDSCVSIRPNITLIGYNDYGPVLLEEHAKHIATMNPSFTLELIERYEALEGKLRKAKQILLFYSQGGNQNMDVWKHENLGYFTGKRAKEILKELEE